MSVWKYELLICIEFLKSIRTLCLLLLLTHPHLHIQAKVNNQGHIGMAYTQSLKTGVKLNLSGLIDGRNINAGGHKLGLSLEFES